MLWKGRVNYHSLPDTGPYPRPDNSFHIHFLNIQNSQHQPTFTFFSGQLQLVNPLMHCPLLYKLKTHKTEHIFQDHGAGSLLVMQQQPPCSDMWRRALLMRSHWGMNVWYILSKMKEAFLAKVCVSNQISLAPSAQECSSFRQWR
jgi:hypothetical protein